MKRLTVALLLVLCVTVFAASYSVAEDVGGEQLLVKHFEVSALLGPNYVELPRLGFKEDTTQMVIEDELMMMDDVISIIIAETGEANWNAEKYLISAGQGRITARNTAKVLDSVSRSVQSHMPKSATYGIVVKLLHFPPEALPVLKNGNFPDVDSFVAAALNAPAFCLFSSEAQCRPMRTALFADTRVEKFITEYFCRVSTMVVGFEPVTEKVSTGTVVTIKPIENEGAVTLNIGFESCEIADVEVFEGPYGRLEKPKLRMFTNSTTLALSKGDFEPIFYVTGGEHRVLVVGIR